MVEMIFLSSKLDPDTNESGEADLGRVQAEYWEDGFATVTPPGHWNVLAMQALEGSDDGDRNDREHLDREITLFLTLNAALHDAAIACWDIKLHYDSVRPISLIRYMASLGQCTDPEGPAFNPLGLPLVPGLIEVVTEESAAPGERHAHLADRIGSIAVYCWRGAPDQLTQQSGGVGWMPGDRWLPYQNRRFVTPAFPGYVSGHSTFSSAAATVLQDFFGTNEIPGGPALCDAPANVFLKFEKGPSHSVNLQCSTFSEAVDQAGRSRVWGGIHPWFDDLAGRAVGTRVAQAVIDAVKSREATAPVPASPHP